MEDIRQRRKSAGSREAGIKRDKAEGWQEMQEMCKQTPHKQPQQQQRKQRTKVRSTTAAILATAGTIGKQQKQQYPQLTNGYTIIANKVATVAIAGNNSSNNINRRNYVCNS